MTDKIGNRNMMKKRRKRRIAKKAEDVYYSFKSILCVIILLSGIVIRFAFYGTDLQKNLSGAIHGNVNYEETMATLGRAVANSGEIISVFKKSEDQEDKNSLNANDEADEKTTALPDDFYKAQTEEIHKEERATQLDAENIEKLSFEMSEAELSDDTKAEVFVIPPPTYCSNEKIDIDFRYASPLYGRITSPYGYRDHPVNGDGGFHSGIDIASPKGTAVKSFAKGKVLEASTNKVYGNYVLIEHSGDIRSFYGHNSKLCVKKGQNVKLGQKIAEVGSTGLSTGPHVHFEIRKGTIRLNPKHYVSPEQI